MPCYSPLKGYKALRVNPTGKRSIVFNKSQGFADLPITLPCGQCIGCRLERSRQWAIRCMHEASLHENNVFITLTYNDENLPKDKSLHKDHFQNFMKRLRKKFGAKIRYFHCGEYGENFGRPHYHACLFNIQFKDKKPWKKINGNLLYTSKTLEQLWTYGFTSIGDVTFESAAYVARYVTKKITGKKAIHHYNEIDYVTGEILTERSPEYVTMSRRPGLGKNFLEKYQTDIYPDDFVLMRERKLKPPKYYNKIFELKFPSDYAEIKAQRKLQGKKHEENNSHDRLSIREEIQLLKYKLLKRSYENGET